MRAKETIRVNVVKTILSDITYAEKAAASTAPVSISTLIQRAIKKRGDSVVQFRASGRDDLAEKEQAEIGLLEQYLPKQMSKEDVEKAVREIVDQVGAKGPKDMGAVMKQVAAKIDDSVAPKKLVAEVVKSVLQSL
ncbi:Yqey-like protein-domain-containing protein [Gaertneriomyces semiglobifer]|nr:Yqey-like protein-domain-containing protein [Gaertneriomyces semiglobifer]